MTFSFIIHPKNVVQYGDLREEIEWRNIKSYGNKLQRIDFSDTGGLIMTIGLNGSGKCLSKKTKCKVDIDDPVVKRKFLEFLKNKKVK